MMTQQEARALMARPVPLAVAAGLLNVPPDALGAVASAEPVTLARAWRAMRRDLESRLAQVRATRRAAYMRARRAVERAARAAVRRDRAQAAVAAFADAVAVKLDGMAATLTGASPRLAARLPGIRRAVADAAREAAELRPRARGKA